MAPATWNNHIMSIPIVDPKGFFIEAHRQLLSYDEPVEIFTKRLNEAFMDEYGLQIITQRDTTNCWLAEGDDSNPDRMAEGLSIFAEFLNKDVHLAGRDCDNDAFHIIYNEEQKEYGYEYLSCFEVSSRDLKALKRAAEALTDSAGGDDPTLVQIHADQLLERLKTIGVL